MRAFFLFNEVVNICTFDSKQPHIMAFTLILFLAIIVTFIFIYFKQKTFRYKIITSVMVVLLAILLFYILVIVLWNSSSNPAETRLRDRATTEQDTH